MVRGGGKGRAKQARDPVGPEIPIAAQEGIIDLDSISKGESSNATVAITTEVSDIEQLWVPSPNTYDAALQSNTIKSSYVAMADPDEVVLCSVIGANPLLEVIEGFVRRIWQACEIDKVCLVRKGVFLVRFQNLNDQFTVVQRGVYFFDNKPFIVKPWSEDMDLNTEDLVSLPVWVRFPDLDVKYWGLESLSKLGSMLGVPIKIDKFIRDKAFLRYARLLIEMQLQDSFPDFIDFVNEDNVVVRQKVEYEWKPSKCTFCKMFGHTDEECRKKPLPKAEWRPIIRQNPPPSSSALVQPSMDAEGFVQEMDEAWCILGDFNAVLYPGDRMGGTEVQFHEIKNFSDCISTYHTAMVLSFPWCPKPKPSFQFCDMWVRDPSFLPLMSTIAEHLVSHDPNTKLKLLLQHAKITLQKLNKDRYAHLKTQLSMARADLEKAQMMLSNSPGDIELLHHVEISRAHYIQILSSVIDIIKQQRKQTGLVTEMNPQGISLPRLRKGRQTHIYY
ncbi:hypothetical protein Cgig2_021401 [Carnegiea gigantea]|uniref:DUF4283 domain-containing protein n=1 Tax=Carnegiea gigantea TaxID=171969 RepID=A0A9Q1GTY8_9CARY|nr:hypothetical protein Cgig2_021401 [Carnegiea gigantea]